MKLVLAMAMAVPGWSGCADPAEFVHGEAINGQLLSLHTQDVGVYPDDSVLLDPDNPFRDAPLGETTKWEIQAGADAVAAFYGWASTLARQPTGEHQFYTAQNLQIIFNEGLAEQDDLDRVRELAILGYQTLLDEFPDAVTFDSTGTLAFDLTTPAHDGIVELGGTVQNGWVLVTLDDGGTRAVKP